MVFTVQLALETDFSEGFGKVSNIEICLNKVNGIVAYLEKKKKNIIIKFIIRTFCYNK